MTPAPHTYASAVRQTLLLRKRRNALDSIRTGAWHQGLGFITVSMRAEAEEVVRDEGF